MSYYEVLGIAPNADEQAILEAYRIKAQESLMDTDAYDQVQEAYETLTSPEKRKAYDALLSESPTEALNITSMPRPGTVPLRRVQSSTADQTVMDSTRAFQAVACPICNQRNAAGEVYCSECGFLLSSTPGAVESPAIGADGTLGPRLENSIGHVYPLKPGLNRVGREHADILILDKTVSRYHALVVFDEERHLFSVEDAGSSNGTRVNDTLLPARSSHQLSNGDEISFGTTRFHLVTGEPVPPTEKTVKTMADGSPSIEITMPPTSSPAKARLTLQRGRGPQEVLLSPGTISIGRLPNNQISLNGDRYASGHHAQIVVEENIFRLIDVGSTNGSFLNGLRLTTNESIAMSDDDEIMIGSTVFLFQKIENVDSLSSAETVAELVDDEPEPILGEAPPIESL